MHKIKRISFIFRLLFQIAFVLLPILMVSFWLYLPFHMVLTGQNVALNTGFIPIRGLQIQGQLSTATILLLFVINAMQLLVVEFILYFLIRLFRLYERAEIFSLQNVKYIKNVGYTLLIGQLLSPVYQAVLTAFLTWHYSPHREITIQFDSMNIAIIIAAFLTILVSWVMAEGCKLQEEQKYIV